MIVLGGCAFCFIICYYLVLFVGLLLFGVGLRQVVYILSCFTFDLWVFDLDFYYLWLLIVWSVNSVVCLLFFLLVVVGVLWLFGFGLVGVPDCGFGDCGLEFVLLLVLCLWLVCALLAAVACWWIIVRLACGLC